MFTKIQHFFFHIYNNFRSTCCRSTRKKNETFHHKVKCSRYVLRLVIQKAAAAAAAAA